MLTWQFVAWVDVVAIKIKTNRKRKTHLNVIHIAWTNSLVTNIATVCAVAYTHSQWVLSLGLRQHERGTEQKIATFLHDAELNALFFICCFFFSLLFDLSVSLFLAFFVCFSLSYLVLMSSNAVSISFGWQWLFLSNFVDLFYATFRERRHILFNKLKLERRKKKIQSQSHKIISDTHT